LTTTGSHRARSAGFTLIEMVVVMMIIALGTALVVPAVQGGWDAREVRRAAREIAATMHYCRGRALATGEPQELVIDSYKNTIHSTGWARWAQLTDRAVIERVEGGNSVEDGVVQILFFPNGSASRAEVVVGNRRDRTQARLAVRLDPLLGTVRVGDAGG
jgi:general secretion pathway protein H